MGINNNRLADDVLDNAINVYETVVRAFEEEPSCDEDYMETIKKHEKEIERIYRESHM